VKRLLDYPGDSVMERTLAELIKEGIIQRYLKKALKTYKARRNLFCHILETKFEDLFRFQKPSGGMAIWAEVLKPYSLSKIADAAFARKLSMAHGEKYALKNEEPNQVRLGSSGLNKEEIRNALKILRNISTQTISPKTEKGIFQK